MNARRFLALPVALAAFGLMACGGSNHRRVAHVAKHNTHAAATPTTPKAGTEAAPKPHAPEYVYSPIGKRDPFRSPFADLHTAPTVKKGGRPQTPLQQWGLEQLTLKATITGTSSPMAMVVDPNGRGWTVHRGTLIGKHWGKVTAITKDCIVITEQVRDASQAVSSVKQQKCLPKDQKDLDFQKQFD